MNIKRIFTSMLLVFMASLSTSTSTYAFYNQFLHIVEDETITQPLIQSAQEIIIDGTVTSDTFLIGHTVIVNGTIEGSLYGIANTVIVNGQIGDASIVAGNTTIVGKLKNLTNISVSLLISQNAAIQEDITSISINNAVSSNSDKANIFPQSLSVFSNPTLLLSFLVASLLAGLACIRWFPNQAVRSIKYIENNLVASLMMGLAVLMIFPSLVLLAALFPPATPLLLIPIGSFIAIFPVALCMSSYWLGARLLNRINRQANKQTTFIIGLMLSGSLISIQAIRPPVILLTTALGIGGSLSAAKRAYHSARKLRII